MAEKGRAKIGRKRKIGRNDLCPCGSELKYKKCHGKNREAHITYHGYAAKVPIMKILADYPKTHELVNNVVDFYGDYLQYEERIDTGSSRFEIILEHKPISLKYASISLNVSTDRVPEALCHELLHLQIPIRGYPQGEEGVMPGHLKPYADIVIDIIKKIKNLVDHEINIELFQDLDFNIEKFLGPPFPFPDYQQIALKESSSENEIEEISFSWWCFEYFRHWVCTRHGYGKEVDQIADSALFWGLKVHPELNKTIEELRTLIESEKIKEKKEYPEQFNALLGLMRLPTFLGWAILQCPDPGKPIAIRL
jgi:hypothetical protein